LHKFSAVIQSPVVAENRAHAKKYFAALNPLAKKAIVCQQIIAAIEG
jgi:hypothetical protein